MEAPPLKQSAATIVTPIETAQALVRIYHSPLRRCPGGSAEFAHIRTSFVKGSRVLCRFEILGCSSSPILCAIRGNEDLDCACAHSHPPCLVCAVADTLPRLTERGGPYRQPCAARSIVAR